MCDDADSEPAEKRPCPNTARQDESLDSTAVLRQDVDRLMQLILLSQKTNEASTSTTTVPDTHFRLVELDPEHGNYTIKEWCDDATQTKAELGVNDHWMLVKAGDAMRGSARRFYNEWKPRMKTWANFVKDMQTAFPDGCTWYQRLQRAHDCTSDDYKTLREYGVDKLRRISAFHDQLPWEKIVSWVEGDLRDASIRELVHSRSPQNEDELLRALVYFEPITKEKEEKRGKLYESSRRRVTYEQHKDRKRKLYRRPSPRRTPSSFLGKCYNCGQVGHRKDACTKSNSTDATTNKAGIQVTSLFCPYCKRPGHNEDTCWKKHGRPARV